jgi:hypothetical protein
MKLPSRENGLRLADADIPLALRAKAIAHQRTVEASGDIEIFSPL